MADIMANISKDDESAIPARRRRKRQLVESDPEDMFNVPHGIKRNPMAPPPKKSKPLEENLTRSIPSVLPLQPALPAQVPPKFAQNTQAWPLSESPPMLNPRSTSESQPPPQRPSLLGAKSASQHECRSQMQPPNPSKPEIPDEDGSIREDNPGDSEDEEDRGFAQSQSQMPVDVDYEDLRSQCLHFYELLYSSTCTFSDHDDIYESPKSTHVDLRVEGLGPFSMSFLAL